MRTSARASTASASASPPSPLDGKAAAESFSYVEPPTTRFVAELPVAPAAPPPPAVADPAAGFERDPLFLSLDSSSTLLPPPLAPPGRAMQHNGAPHHAAPAPAAPPGPSPVPSSFIASDRGLAPSTTDTDTRASSRSRRRLTASLGSLLPGTKRDKARPVEPAPTAATSASAAGSSALAASSTSAGPFGFGTRSRRSSSASRHPVLLSGPAVADSASPYSLPSSSPHPSSTSTSSKPPVSLAKVFRRRNSGSHGSDLASSSSTSSSLTPTSASSPPPPSGRGRSSFELGTDPRRPSLDELTSPLRLSDSSEGSASALTASGSAVSTAPTSPDAPACDEDEGGTAAERRRRGSLALAEQLSRDGRDDEVEDLHDFVVASGSPKPSSTPFARRPSSTPSFTAFPPTSDVDPSRSINTSGASSPPLHPRRLTRNIEGLSLSDLRRSPSETPSPAPVPSQTAAPFAVTSSSPPDSATPVAPVPRDSSNRQRLGALPRLLSTNAIATAGTTESESDTEGDSGSSDEDEDEDEGDHYATGDEGPVTTRSPVGTPAAHTPAASAYGTPRGQPPGGARPPTARMPSLSAVSISTATGPVASGGPSNWVSFAHTPTPAMRTARPQNGISYFDLPRPTSSSSGAAAGGPSASGAPPKTPLAFMSMSDVARGKRPALQEDVDAAASAAASPARIVTVEPAAVAAAVDRSTGTAPASPTTTDGAARAGLYRLRSQSVVALASPRMMDDDGEPLGTAGVTELDPVWKRGVPTAQKTPGFLSFGFAAQKQQEGAAVSDELRRSAPQGSASPTKTPAPLDTSVASSPSSTQPSSPTTLRSRPTTAGAGNRLHRTRSMYELRDAPPAYTSMYRQSGTGAMQVILPREEEGREGLPGYSCAIHIEGYMPRKLEFTAPGVQARDRAWKRQYFVLHGTSIKIFKFDLRTHPLPGEDDWSVVPADIAGSDGPPPLHFHEGEYGVEQPGQGHRFSIELAKAKAKERIIASATASADNALVRHYSLQNAESGLAADYLKRKHVVRVRAEGEQFLLQAKDDRGVIDLIEALQAATNVALDLDARPLPKFITLPRRRRRRRAARPADGTAAAAAGPNGAAATDSTAASTTAAAPAAPDRMGDMLAEEQNAYSRRNSATVM
ncbi:hypothetical protein JCM8208_006852 [Rhodotorula glutinis]